MEQSCPKLPNTTGIFKIYYLNIQKCSFSATSFTEKARKRQMLCLSMIWFRALKPPKLDFKLNCRRRILSSSKWFNSSFPFLAKVLFLGNKDNTKSSSLRIVNPNPSNQRSWKETDSQMCRELLEKQELYKPWDWPLLAFTPHLFFSSV